MYSAPHSGLLAQHSMPAMRVPQDDGKAGQEHENLHWAKIKSNDQQVIQILQNNALNQQPAAGDVPFFANFNNADNIENQANDHANNQNQQPEPNPNQIPTKANPSPSQPIKQSANH